MSVDYAVTSSDAVEVFAAHLIRHASASEVLHAVSDAFPWTKYLSENEHLQFADEVRELIDAPAEFDAMIRSWKGTAENYAEGIRPRDDLEWFTDLPLVSRPT